MNRLYFHTSERMPEIPDETVNLAIAFPPFLHKPRARILRKDQWLHMVEDVYREVFRVLRRKSVLVSINSDVRDRPKYSKKDRAEGTIWWKHAAIRVIAESLGFTCLGTKIWARSLKQDLYRPTHSYLVFYGKQRPHLSTRDNCMAPEFAPDVWLLEGRTRTTLPRGKIFKDGLHPELVRRCIAHFTEPGDLVLSPFAGVGTVPSVAREMNRAWVGYEIDRSLKTCLADRLGPECIVDD